MIWYLSSIIQIVLIIIIILIVVSSPGLVLTLSDIRAGMLVVLVCEHHAVGPVLEGAAT